MSVITCSSCDRHVDTDYDVEVLFCEKCNRTLCSTCTEEAGLEFDSMRCERCPRREMSDGSPCYCEDPNFLELVGHHESACEERRDNRIFFRKTVCAWCGKEMTCGVNPPRLGMCPPCEVFTVMWGPMIREHNAKLDALDAQAPREMEAAS